MAEQSGAEWQNKPEKFAFSKCSRCSSNGAASPMARRRAVRTCWRSEVAHVGEPDTTAIEERWTMGVIIAA
jgi:hypothetical protein